VVQGEHKLLQFRILGTDPCQGQRIETYNEHHEANQNPRCHSRNLVSVFVVFWFSVCEFGGFFMLFKCRERTRYGVHLLKKIMIIICWCKFYSLG
jgi:hypothetical protein